MKPFSHSGSTLCINNAFHTDPIPSDNNINTHHPGINLISPDGDNFSYHCAGCDREITHDCKESRGYQMFMLWKLMAVFEQ